MCVVQMSAYTVFLVLLFVGVGLAHRSAAVAGVVLAFATGPVYFTAIGRAALGLRWPAAVGKALLLLLLLLLLLNSLVNNAAFALFMALG